MNIQFPEIDGLLPVSIPFHDKSVNLITSNIYALGTGPIILIDAGYKFSGNLNYLEEKLKLGGFDFDDIEKIILTHGHVDHFGLVTSIRKVAKRHIECFLHPDDRFQVSNKSFNNSFWNIEKEKFLIRCGVPDPEINNIKSDFTYFQNLADPINGFSYLKEGDHFSGNNYNLKVIHTPGHSPGSCCFYELNKKMLFTGDVIIGHITPNPFVETDKNLLNLRGYQSLKAYMESLEKIRKLKPDYVFPGHGKPVENLSNLISFYFEHTQQRIDFIRNALQKRPGPIYPLLTEIFPDMHKEDLYMAVSDLFSHMEILVSQGRAILVDPGPPEQYCAV